MLNQLPIQNNEISTLRAFSTTKTQPLPTVAYAQGQTVAHIMGLSQRAYVVTSGEVAIYVNGRPVDLIEAGEYFDESIWLGGEAIALTDCTLRFVTEVQPPLF